MTANYNRSVNHTQNFSIPLTNTHELHAAFAVSTIVGLFGVLANLLLLIVIIRLVRHNPDGGSHVLIANLVLIYLLSCCPVLPMVSIPFALSISMPDAYCRYHSLFTYIVYWSANWTEACLGFNRVVAIYFPHKYSKYCNIKVNCVLVALTWLLSLVMTTLVAFFGGATRTAAFGQCEFNVKSRAGGVIIALNTFVPWALIALASIAVIWRAFQVHLARKVEATGNPRSNAQYNSYRRRLQVAKMLLLSFIWGTLCKMPFFVTGAVNKILFITVPLLNSWFKVIVIAEYAVNPIIFFGMSEDYRSGLAALWAYVHSSRTSRPARTLRRNKPVNAVLLQLATITEGRGETTHSSTAATTRTNTRTHAE